MHSSKFTVAVVSSMIVLTLFAPNPVTGHLITRQIEAIGKACYATKADLDIVLSYKIPTSQSGKCLIKCMINKLGLLNPNGTYNKRGVDNALKKHWTEWSKDKVVLINSKCFDEPVFPPQLIAGSCEYAYEMLVCINAHVMDVKQT